MNTLIVTAIRCSLMFLVPALAYAGSAQWNLNPGSGDWNTADNWTPMTVPNGPADIATFALSNITNVSISANTEVNSIVFTPAASNPHTIYALGPTLTISGTGITNNSGVTQNFINYFGSIVFSNSATAGSNVSIFNGGGGETAFLNTSTAGNVFILNFSTGGTTFWDNSSAGSAVIGGADVSYIQFLGSSTAGNATISSAGYINFYESSTAGNATLNSFTATSFYSSLEFSQFSNAGNATLSATGLLSFFDSSDGGTAQIVLGFAPALNIGGYLFIDDHNAPGVTIGSLEDDGTGTATVSLGANNLTVGSNNLSTTFSGVIEDNGFGGSLTKIGSGTLALAGENTYTSATNINGGVLQVDGTISSNTFVNHGGTLAGSGTVNGNVTNSNAGKVSPGDALGVPGVLTVTGNYTQIPSATLLMQIGGADAGQVGVLEVQGNANLNGFIEPVLVNGFVPEIGQSFTFLDYASFTGFFHHIRNPVFDHGRKRWLLAYNATSAVLSVIKNGAH